SRRPKTEYRRPLRAPVVHSPRTVEKPWKAPANVSLENSFPQLWRHMWSVGFSLQNIPFLASRTGPEILIELRLRRCYSRRSPAPTIRGVNTPRGALRRADGRSSMARCVGSIEGGAQRHDVPQLV